MADIGVSTKVQWRDEFGRFAQTLTVGAERSQRDASNLGAQVAAMLAPKRRGTLSGSIHSTGSGFATGALPQAEPQEKGAGPHMIGQPGQILAGDGFGPVRGPVQHPGNPAVHYMRNALRFVNARMMGIIRSNIRT